MRMKYEMSRVQVYCEEADSGRENQHFIIFAEMSEGNGCRCCDDGDSDVGALLQRFCTG